MNGGSKFLASAAILALAGCGGSQAKLEIRPIPAPLSATAKPVPLRIAEAHGHLALGNVALALESYRKALREQPDSVEAMIGIANSYDRMARFDLSRRYYESALAIVPADAGVLNALARSLDSQGRSDEATAVRKEIAVRLAAAKPRGPAIQPAHRSVVLAHAPTPVAGRSVTVDLPAPRPTAAAPAKVSVVPPQPTGVRQMVPVAAPAPKPVPIASTRAPAPAARMSPDRQVFAAPDPSPRPIAVEASLAPVAAAKPSPVRQSASALRPLAPASPSVIVALPPLKPVATPFVAPVMPAAAAAAVVVRSTPLSVAAPIVAPIKIAEPIAAPLSPAPEPVAIARSAPIEPMPRLEAPTRLERLSPGVVVLVTTGKPQWRSQVVGRTAQSTTIRYVPLRTAQVRMVQIRLLNAARHQGLAARTRSLLANRGWRQLAIGDATRVRRTSLILYPPNRRATAERLARQFGFPIAKQASGNEFVMLLGQDATRITVARARG